jgi:hypothetical protein
MSIWNRIAAWYRSTQVGFPKSTKDMTDDELKAEYTKLHSDLVMYGEMTGIQKFRMEAIEDELKKRRIYIVSGVGCSFVKY